MLSTDSTKKVRCLIFSDLVNTKKDPKYKDNVAKTFKEQIVGEKRIRVRGLYARALL